VQADTVVPEPGNPPQAGYAWRDSRWSQALNRYSYVLNNPLRYTDLTGNWLDESGGWSLLPPSREEYLAPLFQHVIWAMDRFKDLKGGVEVLYHREPIARVEQERDIPRGFLGAVIRQEGSSPSKGIAETAAFLGVKTTVGLAEVGVDTASGLEERAIVQPASRNNLELLMRLRDPVQNIEYAGAYLWQLHEWVRNEAPRNITERQSWELAVVAYNMGIEKLKESVRKQGWGALSRRGLNYYYHVMPHVRRLIPLLYPD
jgi:hypothetical protein